MSHSNQKGKWRHFIYEVSSVKFYSCKDCDRRHPACWSTCADYLEEKRKYDNERMRRREARRKEQDFNSVIFAKRGERH